MTYLEANTFSTDNDKAITYAEKELFEYLCLSDAEIAKRTYRSKYTIKALVHRLIKKLEVHNRTEALVKGIRMGLVNTYNIKFNQE